MPFISPILQLSKPQCGMKQRHRLLRVTQLPSETLSVILLSRYDRIRTRMVTFPHSKKVVIVHVSSFVL